MARRGGRTANWVVALAALALLAAASFATVRLVDDGSKLAKRISPGERGREAAQRIRTVMATGDLGSQSSVAVTAQCSESDSAGAPTLALVYPGPDSARTRLQNSGWTELSPTEYEKRFDSWTATVYLNEERAVLTVGSDDILATNCETFRDGLRNLVTASA